MLLSEFAKTHVKKDIESYADVIRLTLGLRREDSTLQALESWLDLLSVENTKSGSLLGPSLRV